MQDKTPDEIREAVRLRAAIDFKTQKRYAEHLGIKTSFLSEVINGRKPPSKRILADIGYTQVVTVKYIKQK